MYKIKARNKSDLVNLIQKEITYSGPSCDLNHIEVNKVVDMSRLFEHTEFNGDISQWDTSRVTDMSYMFHHCNFDGDVSKWNVSNVSNMSGIFFRSQFSGDLSKWNISNVTNAFRPCHPRFFSKLNPLMITCLIHKEDEEDYLFVTDEQLSIFQKYHSFVLNLNENIGDQAMVLYNLMMNKEFINHPMFYEFTI